MDPFYSTYYELHVNTSRMLDDKGALRDLAPTIMYCPYTNERRAPRVLNLYW
jgi:hypothetical protein